MIVQSHRAGDIGDRGCRIQIVWISAQVDIREIAVRSAEATNLQCAGSIVVIVAQNEGDRSVGLGRSDVDAIRLYTILAADEEDLTRPSQDSGSTEHGDVANSNIRNSKRQTYVPLTPVARTGGNYASHAQLGRVVQRN